METFNQRARRAYPHVSNLRRLLPGVAAALLGAPWMGTASAQEIGIHTLLKAGDVLSNGRVVGTFSDASIGANGRWAALVNVAGPPFDTVMVIDGIPVAQTGSVLNNGDIVYSLRRVAVTREGRVGILYDVEDTTPTMDLIDRLRIGGNVVLSTGDSISGLGGALSGTVSVIRGFDFEGELATVSMVIRDPSGGSFSAIVTGNVVTSPGTFVVVDAIVTGDVLPGLTSPVVSLFRDINLSDGGVFAASALLESPGEYGVFADGMGLAEGGQPGPSPGTTWREGGPLGQAVVNGAGDTAVSGAIVQSNGVERRAIYYGNSPIAVEGSPIIGVPGPVVEPFNRAHMRMTEYGELIFAIELSGDDFRLMKESRTLAASGDYTAEGDEIELLIASSTWNTFDATPDGSTVLARTFLDVGAALLLIEDGISTQAFCAFVPNSTGGQGSLVATGSKYVEINDLTITAGSLPLNTFGYLLASRDSGFANMPGGSNGNLCLGSAIGRFAGQVQSSGATGEISTTVDLSAIPQPSGSIAGVRGDTWYFQLWHRDGGGGGGSSSNFTESIRMELK